MDTGSLGFMIPSLFDIIEFVVFKAIPITVILLLLLTWGIRYKTRTNTNALFSANGVILIVLIVLYGFVSGINFFPGLLFVTLFIVVYLSVCSLFVYLFYYLYDRSKTNALMYSLVLLALFLFFYPKEQNWYRNEDDRIVPAVSCECIGFSEERIYDSSYGFIKARCFGLPLQCRESMQDRCPFLPPDEECITVDVYDLS